MYLWICVGSPNEFDTKVLHDEFIKLLNNVNT